METPIWNRNTSLLSLSLSIDSLLREVDTPPKRRSAPKRRVRVRAAKSSRQQRKRLSVA